MTKELHDLEQAARSLSAAVDAAVARRQAEEAEHAALVRRLEAEIGGLKAELDEARHVTLPDGARITVGRLFELWQKGAEIARELAAASVDFSDERVPYEIVRVRRGLVAKAAAFAAERRGGDDRRA
jgi:hypothetical protein